MVLEGGGDGIDGETVTTGRRKVAAVLYDDVLVRCIRMTTTMRKSKDQGEVVLTIGFLLLSECQFPR